MNYYDAVKYISNIPKFTKKNSLNHTKLFLDELGINLDKLKVIHVAGTNGKGTVCAMISNVLVKCKKNTGLFISPHLVNINERIMINNVQIDDKNFADIFNIIKMKVDKMKDIGVAHPSFFEFLFLMAMYEFNRKGVEYVVLETGLGGRLDATNVIEKPYITIITSIGMDHMEYLGDTIEKITEEKAGIIKSGVPIIFWGANPCVTTVIEKRAKEINSKIIKVDTTNYEIIKKTDKSVDFSVLNGYYLKGIFSIPFISDYQVQNAVVAIKAIECIEEIRDNINEIREGISDVKWEGRMEIVSPGVIFDGAHNGPGIDEFIKTFNEYTCKGRKIILFSVVRDKDYDYMVSQLVKTNVSMVFVTKIDSERGLETDKIYNDFKNNDNDVKVIIKENVMDAFSSALNEKGGNDVLFCVGSLYLIGELKKCIMRMNKNKLE